jgi:hypothetical protein
MLISRPTLRTLFDAIELMAPVLLKFLCPVVHAFQFLGVKLIQTLLALLVNRDQAHLAQHAEVLRNGWLRHRQGHDQSADRDGAAPGEHLEDLTPPRLRDGVEDVAGRWGTGHNLNIFSYGNMSSGQVYPRGTMPQSLLPILVDRGKRESTTVGHWLSFSGKLHPLPPG